MDRVNGHDTFDIGDGRRGFRAENLPAGIVGTEITADWLNGVQEELAALIARAGYDLSGDDLVQVLRAIRSQRANFAAAEGTGDALSLALEPAPLSLVDLTGMPLRVVVSAQNTGPATLQLGDLPPQPIVRADNGGPLLGRDWQAGAVLDLLNDGAAWRLVSPQARNKPPALLFYGCL
ncbi:hypothetical protein [Pararhodobacter sp.]|uniref:hypothetical protein n=1 Tax=Pararhodobacter sp. TaxID=2127056 RepID=UPI002AFF0201|nr:hypothetical protein [Pararhodobacter sp.]